MKADGLARKAPRRWAQVSRIKGAMVRHTGPCREERGGDQGGPRDRRCRPEAARRRPSPCANPEGVSVPPESLTDLCHAKTPSRDPTLGS